MDSVVGHLHENRVAGSGGDGPLAKLQPVWYLSPWSAIQLVPFYTNYDLGLIAVFLRHPYVNGFKASVSMSV